MPCDFSFSQTRRVPFNAYGQRSQRVERRAIVQRDSSSGGKWPNPAVPPSAAVRQVVRIPSAVAGPQYACSADSAGIKSRGQLAEVSANVARAGMVAARHGHVFVLGNADIEGDTWMAYDANSGGHASRIHARSLRGYTIVNPHG